MAELNTIDVKLLTFSWNQIQLVMPYLFVFFGILISIFISILPLFNPKWLIFLITTLTCGFGIYSSYELLFQGPEILLNQMLAMDAYSYFFQIIFLASAGMITCISFRYLDKQKLQHPEYYILLLFSMLGMMFMVAALDLIVIFISIELMSLSVYPLVGFRRSDRKSNEAALKYFILGSVASALFLYGIALLYGMTGTTHIQSIFALIQQTQGEHPKSIPPVFLLGICFVLCGFFFKVAVVPFHGWMPDVYEGAPVPITGFMATALKAASFAVFIRVCVLLGYGNGMPSLIVKNIHAILWIGAVLAMILGNGVALTQINLKRLLAYSSIAHTGYLLIGIMTGTFNELHIMPVIFYLVAYVIASLGIFTLFTLFAAPDDAGLNLHDLTGLAKWHPWLAAAMAIFFFSMAGIPLTAGFIGKYLLLYGAIQANEIPIVIIAVLCSAVSVYYYLRVLVYMYMYDPIGSPPVLRISIGSRAVLMATVFLTLYIGIAPEGMIRTIKKVVHQSFFQEEHRTH